MDIETIEIPVDVAKERLAEYRAALRVDRNAEDAAIARGYLAASKGHGVIKLSDVIAAGGFFETGLPRLAVARADARWVRVDTQIWSGPRLPGMHAIVYYDDAAPDGERGNRGALVNAHTVRIEIPEDRYPLKGWQRVSRGQTTAPIIPPRHRPRFLRNFHILWEVEQWTSVPPTDPALIHHIGGDLWSVHAVWDLTELERAVLAGRP